jgi:hypothetical protein
MEALVPVDGSPEPPATYDARGDDEQDQAGENLPASELRIRCQPTGV